MPSVEIPYSKNTLELFEQVAQKPWAVLLDSGKTNIQKSRYDIFAFEPHAIIESYLDKVILTQNGISRVSQEDPLQLLKKILGPRKKNDTNLPFIGGVIGFLSYDFSRKIASFPYKENYDNRMPNMAVAFYNWSVVVDHHEKKSWMGCYDKNIMQKEIWKTWYEKLHAPVSHKRTETSVFSNATISQNLSFIEYANAFKKIKRYIQNGDCYQVNLAIRFLVENPPEAWSIYKLLHQSNPAPYSCYIHTQRFAILSNSPESFLSVKNNQVKTKPIKGTRKTYNTPEMDSFITHDLYHSVKDRAENLMIVDLMRNDLGKSCKIGSVSVPRLFNIESFPNVHHMVSTVQGELPNHIHPLQLLSNAFPPGSITGAPKIRAMQIIDELEPHQRHIYCGTIGYIGYDWDMECNVAIRTLLHTPSQLLFWGGGGIVHDSVLEQEYEECLNKVSAFIDLFKKSCG